jgi:hypothetical protein
MADEVVPNVPVDQTRNLNTNLKVVIPPEASFSIEITNFVMSADPDHPEAIDSVTWEMTMVYGKYVGSTAGSVKLPPPDASQFTPLDQLTKEQVVAWLGEHENMEEMKERLVRDMNFRLRRVINKPVFKMP